ncbi:MAG: protein kinase [Prosthecobacter sp.]|uniref:protein kinase domain-containing protein n=1 Tax=Prosthecobacter sp. TaxID=1965333 RepID=UPI0025DA438E|nr:protein kinase [Prosthecobacter sp.]MCF7786206.1 protein kinase [Prosthecobacter sp.]
MCRDASSNKPEGPEEDEDTLHLEQAEEPVHEQIDRYRLLNVIGTGGFGSVWHAEQEGPVPRRVALKVVKPGMDTRAVIAQFEAERQLLALMDHPCIAKVYDAGETSEGLPYFVMELVGGIPITRFCSEHHLSTAERLRLFMDVCKALQHAHQKGVSHRDIKPSNILVCKTDGKPLPKVIDFGIARATRPMPNGVKTHPPNDQLVGTPVYMSPEQTAGNIDIDTRCDVYALGVLLYELLTGCTPFDQKKLQEAGEQEIRRVIGEEVPAKPSAVLAAMPRETAAKIAAGQQSSPAMLMTALREDLDWIVMKAMQKDRNQRYETANGLAMDVERYLMSEPIVARPSTNRYRLDKLVNRNRLVFTMGTLVGVALLSGISISGMQTYRITQVEHEHDRLRALAEQSERRAHDDKEAARRSLAKAQIALADAAYRDQDGSAMQAALLAVPQDMRDSNWYYLTEKSDTSVASIQVPSGAAVERVLPHPTKEGVFITVSSDYWVSITKLGSEATLLSFQLGFKDRSATDFCLTISPDGEQLAAAKISGGGIIIHNLRDGEVISRWEDAGTDALIYSPDGRRLLDIAHNGPAHMRLAQTGAILWTAEGNETILLAAFDPSGRQLVCNKAVGGQRLQIVNAFNGVMLRELSAPRTRLTALAVSPDGRQVLTGDQRGFVRSIALKTGNIRYEFRANDRAVSALAYAHDGRQFITLSNLSGGRQSIKVWDASTGVFLQPLLNAGSTGSKLCVHPVSGEILATGITAKAWRLKGLSEEFRLPARDFANTCFWSSDDLVFAHGANTGIDLIDLHDDEAQSHPLWRSADKSARLVTASRDGSMAAVASSNKAVTDIQLLRRDNLSVVELRHLTAPGGLLFMHFDPSGERLLVRAASSFYVVDSESGHSTTIPWDKMFSIREAEWVGTSSHIIALLVAKNSRSLPGSEDRLLLFDAISGECLHTTLSSSVINAIAVSPDGTLFAEGGADRMVRLRNTKTFAVTQELRVHDSPIMALAFHPTLHILATASDDLTIKLWNLADGKLLEELSGPVGPPRQLAFSLKGRRLACLSGDRSMRIWNLDAIPDSKTSD